MLTAALLSLAAYSPVATTEPPFSPPAIIVSIRWEEDKRDALTFINALRNDSFVSNAIGGFTKIEPLFLANNPAPGFYEVPEYSASWLLKRYIKITYPLLVDVPLRLEALRRTGKFGYIGLPPTITFEATPTDPYWNLGNGLPPPYGGQNWAHQTLNIPAAWDYLDSSSGLTSPNPQILTGGTRIAVLDSGVYLQPPTSACDQLPHEDLVTNLKSQMSIGGTRTVPPTSNCGPTVLWPSENMGQSGHGTHVLGLVSGTANNGIGTSGVCWSCPTGIAASASDAQTLQSMLRQAPAIVSLSLGFSYDIRPVCNFQSSDHPWCPLLQLADERDQTIVAATGNDLTLPKFPAYHFSVLGIGGLGTTTDAQGRPKAWDDRPPGGAGCPTLPTISVPSGWPGPAPIAECGTNDNPSAPVRFFAPAKDILSTFSLAGNWNQPAGCFDATVDTNAPVRPGWSQFMPVQYEYCTGTSMSTPLMAGAIALVRSVNPAISKSGLAAVLERSRTQVSSTLTGNRDGVLDTKAAIELLLGKLGNTQLQNRLTPMFVLKNTLQGTFQIPSHSSWLFTTSLPVAYAAIENTLYDQQTDPWRPLGSWSYNEGFGPNIRIHRINETGIRNFTFNQTFDQIHAGAFFFTYTTPNNPFSTGAMRPLYRLSFDDMFNNSTFAWCLGRDHAYAINQIGLNWFMTNDFCSNQAVAENQSYRLEGLEGYLLPSCPLAGGCNSSGAAFQCIHIRGKPTSLRPEGEDWALIPYSMLPSTPGAPSTFSGYTTTPTGAPTPAQGEQPGCLGYAAMNIDSDNDSLIDGVELSFFSGVSNPHLNPNIDDDLLTDDIEYQPLGLVMSNPLVACSTQNNGECDGLFRNGFEGETSFYVSPPNE